MDITLNPQKMCGKVLAPSSKSYLHRALILSAFSKGKTTIKYRGLSKDILATINCLTALGTEITYNNEEIIVGEMKESQAPATIDCNESGTTLRFMLPLVAALGKEVIITGAPRLAERPIKPLCDALIKNGAEIDYKENQFPIKVKGKLKKGEYKISGNISSQFVSGLIIALSLGEGGRVSVMEKMVSTPYIDITLGVLKEFGIEVRREENTFFIPDEPLKAPEIIISEGDYSNGAFWLVLGAIGGDIEVENLSPKTMQGDREIIEILKKMGADIKVEKDKISVKKSILHAIEIDAENIPDLVPVLSVLASCANGKTVIKNVSRLREKESDRIKSTLEMINNLGGNISFDGEAIIVQKAKLTGGVVDSYNDHRIAMSSAVASLVSKGTVTIKGAEAVNKSYTGFFDDFKHLECE